MKHKVVSFDIVDTKQVTENDNKYFIIKGFGSTFGNVDRQKEVMVKGCFEESLKELTPIFLWQHKMSEPIGVFITIYENEKGLYLEAKMPLGDDFVKGRVKPQVEVGSVRTMSIGFSIIMDEYDRETNITYIKKVKLYEVSLVTIPANAEAVISDYKDFDKELEESKNIRDLERYLKNIGISNKKSAIIISKIKTFVRDEQINQCDIDSELNKFLQGVKQLKMEV